MSKETSLWMKCEGIEEERTFPKWKVKIKKIKKKMRFGDIKSTDNFC